jgi:hypothetical protein
MTNIEKLIQQIQIQLKALSISQPDVLVKVVKA